MKTYSITYSQPGCPLLLIIYGRAMHKVCEIYSILIQQDYLIIDVFEDSSMLKRAWQWTRGELHPGDQDDKPDLATTPGPLPETLDNDQRKMVTYW